LRVAVFLAVLAASACAPAPGASQARETIADRDWQLVRIERGAGGGPTFAGARPPTLRLDSKEGRASGFAGCNRFSGSYQLAGDRLTFGPLLSTKMACERGMDVEAAYLDALAKTGSWSQGEGEIVLRGAGGVSMSFRAEATSP
jgi:heat shock protein HslJ